MRASSILAPVFILALFLIGLLPRLSRTRQSHADLTMDGLLPATALTSLSAGASVMTPDPFASLSADRSIAPVAGAPLPGYPGLDDFAMPLLNGLAGDVVGVYAPGVFALPVAQQPPGEPAYVSENTNEITQFQMASLYGTAGLLAHNYLSGASFFSLGIDQELIIIYGDGRLASFRVERIERYQALEPASPFSDFVDVSQPGSAVLTSAALFNHIYTTPGQVVFQTCIESGDESSWGRLFVIATPDTWAGFETPARLQYVSDN